MSQHKQPGKDWAKLADEDLADETSHTEKTEKSSGFLEHPEYAELEDKLTKAEQHAQQKTEECLRLQAEMQNIIRRGRIDVENAHKYGVERLVKELTEVIDNLERTLESLHELPEQFAQLRTGIELTYKMFLDTLAKFGVKVVNPVNEPFDPKFHEAVSMMPSDAPSNQVLQVLQKGYLLNERVVRPAIVIVAK